VSVRALGVRAALVALTACGGDARDGAGLVQLMGTPTLDGAAGRGRDADAEESADLVVARDVGGEVDAGPAADTGVETEGGDTSVEDTSAEDTSADDTIVDTSADDTIVDTSAEDTSAEDTSAEDTSAEDTVVVIDPSVEDTVVDDTTVMIDTIVVTEVVGPDGVVLREDGEACGGDEACASGHCDSGFCCALGTCCGASDDCAFLDGEPTCDDVGACSGSRVVGVCSAAFVCEAAIVLAPEACAGERCAPGQCKNLELGGVIEEGLVRHTCSQSGTCLEEVVDCRVAGTVSYCTDDSDFYLCQGCAPEREACLVLGVPCYCHD